MMNDRLRCWIVGIVFLILGTGSLLAQNPNGLVTYEFETVIPFGSKGFVAIMLKNADRPFGIALRYFDNEENLISEKEIDLRTMGLINQYEGAFAWQGKLCIVTSLYYPGPKRNNLLFRQFNLPDLSEEEAVAIDEAYTPQRFRIPFGYSVSPDSSKIMFYSWTYTLPEDNAKVSIKVYDTQMALLWEQRYILPFKNERLYIFDCAVNDEGRAFLFCEDYKGRMRRQYEEEEIDYFVLAGIAGNTNVLKYDLNLTTKVITGLKIRMDSTNAIIGGAMYRDEKGKRHDGVYLFRIPPDGKEIQRKQLSIPEEEYEAAYPYGEKESAFNSNRHKFTDYFVDYVFTDSSGNWYVVAEQRIEQLNYQNIEFNDILVLKTTPNQDRVRWITRISKRHLGFQGDWGVFSYRLRRKGDQLFFLYNDLADNYKQNPPRVLRTYEGTRALMLITELKPNGEQVRMDATAAIRKRKMAAFWPARIWELGNDEGLIFYGEYMVRGSAVGLLLGFKWEDILP